MNLARRTLRRLREAETDEVYRLLAVPQSWFRGFRRGHRDLLDLLHDRRASLLLVGIVAAAMAAAFVLR